MYEDSEKEGAGGPSKSCVVCSDRALSCNFGAITCESCKAFFRRHAHKEIYGQCDGNCPITVETRSYCRRCRLAKCFTVGMKKDLILSDEQKQRRRQKILENRTKRQSAEVYSPDSSGVTEMPPGQTNDPSPGSMDLMPDSESGGWSGQPMGTSPPEYMSTSVPKRDIWQSMDGGYTQEDIKRQAFESIKLGSYEPVNKKEVFNKNFEVGDAGFALSGGFPPTPYSDNTSPTLPLPPIQKMRKLSGSPEPYKPLEEPGIGIQCSSTSTDGVQSNAHSDGVKDLHPSMYEPCFFGLHPPTLDTVAFSRLDKDIQDSLLTAIEAYRELCRPLLSIYDKPKPEDYVTLLNRGEECYRQLVRFSKKLPEFRALSQDDQIALLKGNVIEIMIIRFSKCYNLKSQSWVFPQCGDMQSYSGMVNSSLSGFCVEDYSNFVMAALEVSEGDDLILIMLKVITLFWPDVPNLTDKEGVTETFSRYNKALEDYLHVMYPDNTGMLNRIHDVMEQLRNVGKKAHDVMWKSQVQDLHPLLKEMFDLR